MFWPCETRTSTCRSFATISSGLYRFLAIAVLLDVKDIPQVGPLQWGWISASRSQCRMEAPERARSMAARGWTTQRGLITQMADYLPPMAPVSTNTLSWLEERIMSLRAIELF